MKAIFLDRDGVMIFDRGHLVSTDQVEVIDSSISAVRILNSMGYTVLGISNQSVVARGLSTISGVQKVNSHILEEYRKHNAFIQKIYFCPHHPQGTVKEYAKKCICRKPAPGMIIDAAKEFDLDLKNSWIVGDQPTDILAGISAGCNTALVPSRYWTLNELTTQPQLFCSDLKDFVDKLKLWLNEHK